MRDLLNAAGMPRHLHALRLEVPAPQTERQQEDLRKALNKWEAANKWYRYLLSSSQRPPSVSKGNGRRFLPLTPAPKSPDLKTRLRDLLTEIALTQQEICKALSAQITARADLPGESSDYMQTRRIAENSLDALPEVIAAAFSLQIRASCTACDTIIFTCDPKATIADGRDICEQCAEADNG